MVALGDIKYVIDENLLRVGKGVVAARRDTARFSQSPIEDLLPTGILDPEWITRGRQPGLNRYHQ